MAIFKANFTYFPNVIFAPAKIKFDNLSTVGVPAIDQFTFAINDADGTQFVPPLALSSYLVSSIDKMEWDFGDGEISNEFEPNKVYDFSGTYIVKLSVYSQKIFDISTGVFFRLKNVLTQNISIGSMTFAWLKQHMTSPHVEALESSQGFNDLISASSRLFDRMYKDIKDVSTLMDIQHVAPKFLEFFSDTLNHQRFYAEKVGYAAQLDDVLKQKFLDYNIFSRITAGTASDDEIRAFREFILDTAAMFKQNGSKQAMENFFKLYNFVVQIKEMWTTNFGTTPIDDIIDDFFLDPTLENSHNKFKFKGVNVVGLDNSLAQYSNGFNNLLIDNYHFLTRHAYSDGSRNANCTVSFDINDFAPHINNIVRDDGRSIINKIPCLGYDIFTPCASAEPEATCTDDNVLIVPNTNWIVSNDVVSGVSYKFWNSPDGYVQRVITTLGTIPNGPDEIAEIDGLADTDEYLWADWQSGVNVPSTVVGVPQLKKPNFVSNFPGVNFATTLINDNLVQVAGIPIETDHDLFVVARGFLKISTQAYYNFTLDIGNVGSGDGSQHIALFSLKHTTPYTQDAVNHFKNVDDFTFIKDNTDSVQTIGTTATGLTNIYSKVGEYGIIEIRQNEMTETSGTYNLTPGFYAFEIKSTYSSLVTKNLKLSWNAFNIVIEPTQLIVNTIIPENVIPSNAFYTISPRTSVIDDNSGKGTLTIPNELIEGADVFTVSYSEGNATTDVLSGIISRDQQFKDLSINVRFSPVAIPHWQELHNRSLPQRALLVMFRAINKGKNLYDDVDTYYAAILNGNTGEVSLAEVSYSAEVDGPYFRYLNLNKDLASKDQRVYSNVITDTYGQLVTLQDGSYYDLKVSIRDNKVSVFFRSNVQFTTAFNNVKKSISQDLVNFKENDSYQIIIDSVSLDQQDADTKILDTLGNTLFVSEKYQLNDKAGFYGLAIRSSVFKINQFHVSPLDKIDNNLLETVDKWKKIKPKFLDSRNNDLLHENSYETVGADSATSPTFNVNATSSYDGSVNVFDLPTTLGSVDDNSVNVLFADNVSVTGWGTRFNVWVDKDFINARFKTAEQVMDSLLIPYGNMFEPFVNWSRVESASASYTQTVQAGFTPFINENAHVLPHTISLSGSTIEYVSALSRNAIDSTILECDTVLKPFLESTTHSTYLGFWEEVCPLSVSPTWTVSGQTFNNKVFQLIYRNNITKTEIIGVRVVDQPTMDKLICRYCQDGVVWGLYDITLPTYAVSNEIIYDTDVPQTTTVRYFVPIGKLNRDFVFMLPPPEILRNQVGTVNLVGVYAQHSFTGFNLVSPSKSVFTITEPNPWEKDYKSKIQCKYFLDLETSFVDKFTQHNIALSPNPSTPCEPGNELERNVNDTVCVLPNTFYMPKQITNLFTYLETHSIDFTDDYNYWTPKQVWVKRKFDVVYPANDDTHIFSGLNAPNAFFTGTTQLSGFQGTNLSLQDSYFADIGKYVVDVSWCASSVGWDAEFATKAANTFGVGVFSLSAYNLIGFDPASKTTMGAEKLVPLGNFLNAPIPLETVSVSGVSSLAFGSYLTGEMGTGKSFIPVGLFNWFLTHANQVDDTSAVPRAGWDLTDFNNEFVNCVKFNGIYGEMSPVSFKINKYWAFYPTQIPPFGAVVRITKGGGNCIDVDGTNAPVANSVDITIGVSDGLSAFFSVPTLVEPFPKWYSQISNVFVDNYVFPTDHYTVRNNTATNIPQLVLNNQLFDFSKFVGPTNFNVNFIFDKLFKLTEQTKLVDDFGQTRQINWLTLIEETDHYKIAKRLPDTELKFTANALPYAIGSYQNNSVFKLVNKFDFVNPSQFSGVATKEVEVGIAGNHGSINTMQLTDVESSNYTLSCDVIFDKTIINTDFDKHFELILKAENDFVRDQKEWGITNYYYVGIGTYNFDIGLGMRTIDINGNAQETFLASHGEFNVRNIKADTWYTIKAVVSNTTIQIYFNERRENEELVINYNTNKKYEKLSDRYLKGEFETLQAVIVGLESLGITYPDKLGNTVSSSYTFKNFKSEFASTLPVNGYYTGFRVFNPLTYLTNVNYIVNTTKKYKYGSAFDGTAYGDILARINTRFGIPKNPNIKKVSRTLNFSTFVQINDSLFYQFENNDPQKYPHPVSTFETIDDKIIIVEKEIPKDSAVGINDFAVGSHTFVWSLSDNTQNIVSMQDFFSSVPDLNGVAMTRNGTTYHTGLTVGTSGISGDNVILKVGDSITLTIGGSRNVIWPLGGTLGRFNTFVRVFQEGFTQEYPVLIKDKTFYKDGLKSYMNFADKNIKEVHINDNRLHIIFEDN